MKRTIHFLAFALVLSACASTAPVLRETAAAPGKVTLIFAGHRSLDLEPCGCSTAPFGGLVREWNVVEGFRKTISKGTKVVSLSGGNTFVPEQTTYQASKKDLYVRKADYLIEGMNELGTTALSPSINDFSLGMKEMKALEAKAKFPFISTNLYARATQKPVFKPYVEIEAGALSVLVLGISDSVASPYTGSPEVEVKPPADAIKAVLASLPAKPRMVVLLSPLSDEKRELLRREVPQINVILGGAPGTHTYEAEQVTGSLVQANPLNRARAVVRMDFDTKASFAAFFNPTMSRGYEEARPYWTAELAQVEKKLKRKKLKKAERMVLLESRNRLERFIERADSVPQAAAEHTIGFESQTVSLEAKYDQPKNKMSELVERYKAKLRELALGDE